jgi:hemerythrin superfamily protein
VAGKIAGTTRERLHTENVVEILLRQHERIRSSFELVTAARGKRRQERFDELRALLAAHETAEEMVLRPTSVRLGGSEIADARNAEEHEANQVLAGLEKLDVNTPEFETEFEAFRKAVFAHARKEEKEEFPLLQKGRSEEDLAQLGRVFLAVEKIAPTHPHPTAAGSPSLQWAVGPFASIMDRARDALTAAAKG